MPLSAKIACAPERSPDSPAAMRAASILLGLGDLVLGLLLGVRLAFLLLLGEDRVARVGASLGICAAAHGDVRSVLGLGERVGVAVSAFLRLGDGRAGLVEHYFNVIIDRIGDARILGSCWRCSRLQEAHPEPSLPTLG